MFLEKSPGFSVILIIALGFSEIAECNAEAKDKSLGSKNFGFDKELVLTEKEKNVFEKFKAAVFKNLTQEFMKQDLFMLRWIRSKNLNADQSVKEMFNFLEFWKENNLDGILLEKMQDLEEEFPFHIAHDRKGRPIAYGSTTNGWNVRRGIIQGKRPRLMRYIYKIILGLNDELVGIQKQNANNVTSFVIMMNLNGFNLYEHACPICITTYINLLETYEKFLPQHANEIIILNTPPAFTVVLDMVKPVLSRHTRDRLRIFGPNKKKWKPYLDARIDPKELPWDFGGTLKDENNDEDR